MNNIDIFSIVIGVMSGLVFFTIADYVVPEWHTKRVGGITHWTFGRFGGSIYKRKS